MRLKKSVLTWLTAVALAFTASMVAATPASANLNVISVTTATSATMTWTNPVVAFTGVNVDYKVHTDTVWTSVATNITSTSRVVTGLQPVTNYDFRVTAYNGATLLEFMTATATTLFANACAPGTFSTTGYDDATCNPAPPGSFVPASGYTQALLCPLGRYADQPGSTICAPARVGRYTSVLGSAIDILCDPGTYAAGIGSIFCTQARVGYYVPGPGEFSETVCPAGTTTLSSGQSACSPISTRKPSVNKLVFEPKSNTASQGSIIGVDLGDVSSVLVGSASATVTKATDDALAVTLPALKPGTYDLVIKFSNSGSYTIQGAIFVGAEAVTAPAAKEPARPVTVSIGGFRTTATDLNTTQMAALSAGIAQAPAGCNVSATVVAYAAGGRAARNAASARADKLNQILHAKFPGAQVSVSVVASKALADARNVSVTFSPAN